jgi:hypothetical protein
VFSGKCYLAIDYAANYSIALLKGDFVKSGQGSCGGIKRKDKGVEIISVSDLNKKF